MATKLLPSTKFTASKKIISADSIKSVSKDSSATEKLGAIRERIVKFTITSHKKRQRMGILIGNEKGRNSKLNNT